MKIYGWHWKSSMTKTSHLLLTVNIFTFYMVNKKLWWKQFWINYSHDLKLRGNRSSLTERINIKRATTYWVDFMSDNSLAFIYCVGKQPEMLRCWLLSAPWLLERRLWCWKLSVCMRCLWGAEPTAKICSFAAQAHQKIRKYYSRCCSIWTSSSLWTAAPHWTELIQAKFWWIMQMILTI